MIRAPRLDARGKSSQGGHMPQTQTELVPANVERLHTLGIQFTRRMAGHDLITACPICRRGKLIIDEEKPFFICLGDFDCVAGQLNFDQLVCALERDK